MSPKHGANNSPQWVLERFVEVLTQDAEQRKMFGFPAARINGHLFVMLVDEEPGLRISPNHREDILKIEGSGPYAPRSNCHFKDLVLVPKTILNETNILKQWLEKSAEYTRTLAPKQPKSRKKA